MTLATLKNLEWLPLLVSGFNTLDFIVTNGANSNPTNPTGLLVSGTEPEVNPILSRRRFRSTQVAWPGPSWACSGGGDGVELL
jgi:hypothetical protein